MATFKKGGLMDGAGSEAEFKYDPEAEENAKKYRLPFALCKNYGIAIQDWWRPRDAWDALKRGGHVEDVSDEYKEYYRELKKTEAKRKRKERYQRSKLKKKQLQDPAHNPDKSYKHVDGQIAGAKRGKPMTFEEADSGRVNPYYKDGVARKAIGYQTNCQTCVATYIARRQGYDVRALPNLNNRAIFQLSHNTSLAFVNDAGQHPKYLIKPQGVKTTVFLDQKIRQNETYSVEFTWRGSSKGHIVTAERDKDGALRVYDPQTNMVYKGKGISQFLGRGTGFRCMNLTNCKIDEKFADLIMKSNK